MILPFVILLLPFLSVVHSWVWSTVSSQAPKVSGHSVGSISSDEIILFGGLTGPAGSPCTDDTWYFNGKEWSLVDCDQKPRVRMYAASAVLNEKFYIFGGWDPMSPGSGGEFLDDIWQFDWTKKEWKCLESKLPYPVSRHTACTISNENSIIIHTYQKNLLVFKEDFITEQETKGDHQPIGYSMCAVAPLSSTKMVLFGGSTKNQQMSQDAYLLDTETWTWTKLLIAEDGEAPPIMASCSAAPMSENQLLLFGGAGIQPTGYEGGMGLVPQDETWMLTVLDDTTARWTKTDCLTKPDGRVAASLSPVGSSFLLQGGYDPLAKCTFDAPWILKP
mmetsp:Transcript_31846/g.48121  ORF Transcript_31846/g.48121 Transcript_31846/m.48121 type:complete len:333 (+) Transcript_31846:37-1035(+)